MYFIMERSKHNIDYYLNKFNFIDLPWQEDKQIIMSFASKSLAKEYYSIIISKIKRSPFIALKLNLCYYIIDEKFRIVETL